MFSVYLWRHDVISRNYKLIQRCYVRREIHLCTVLNRTSYRSYIPPYSAEQLREQHIKKAERRVGVVLGLTVLGAVVGVSYLTTMSKTKTRTPILGSRPLVIAGPSGAGKSTLLKEMFKEFPDQFGFSVSHTSRKPREGEVTGKQYHFSSRQEIQKGIDNGEFIEWAEYSSNLYGTSKQSVHDVVHDGKICVLDIDMQGVRSMKKTDFNPLYVFIKPPSIEELERRLRSRGSETEESIQRRLAVAKEEIEYAELPGIFHHTIINTTVEDAYGELREIVIKEIDAARTVPHLQDK